MLNCQISMGFPSLRTLQFNSILSAGLIGEMLWFMIVI